VTGTGIAIGSAYQKMPRSSREWRAPDVIAVNETIM
jgi:hypothetical protein